MWLIDSSIGRKVVMSVTGLALILFLTFHASMNVVALFSAEGYNMICEFLGANWYAVVATLGLAALMALHFVFAIILTIQNKKARGTDAYAVTDKPEKVEWYSQNMFLLGCIICLGLCLHLWHFWYNMMWAELQPHLSRRRLRMDCMDIPRSAWCSHLLPAVSDLVLCHLVPHEPWFLERYPDTGLERQDLAQPLAVHRLHLVHHRHPDVCCGGPQVRHFWLTLPSPSLVGREWSPFQE